MMINAVIVKSKKRKIKEISNASRKISFYKNEEIASKNIEGIINILIDTDNMSFFGKDNVSVQSKPTFFETDIEYVFLFEKNILDLHCKINICN